MKLISLTAETPIQLEGKIENELRDIGDRFVSLSCFVDSLCAPGSDEYFVAMIVCKEEEEAEEDKGSISISNFKEGDRVECDELGLGRVVTFKPPFMNVEFDEDEKKGLGPGAWGYNISGTVAGSEHDHKKWIRKVSE